MTSSLLRPHKAHNAICSPRWLKSITRCSAAPASPQDSASPNRQTSANAHATLEISFAAKSLNRGSVALPNSANSLLSDYPVFANDHAVFANSCGWNLLTHQCALLADAANSFASH
eukprot:gnl/TRDRNA2_/TRDRNA2_174685_c9_seq3.p1 gnl/TRDRNA2_/TRDRNA2_174685_c9~~gnl/TRDRNA2_/TRDRNA2_174685_c9_seq3.p1  ORF type:complete len:116 (-),score=1.04 gnl/TRDRNA2_/TRDRNA2_174685_c9_seq3:31-378(-)